MFRNHLKIGTRNLWKYKSSTAINMVGLSIGLAAFLLIALFVKDELSYDRNHEHAKNIYRITVKNYTQEGDLSRHWAFASAGHAKRIKDDYSDITHAARFFLWAFPDIHYQSKNLPAEQVVFADKDVFDIFSFEFLAGHQESAFSKPESIVLTRASAIKIFGNDWQEQDIIGAQIKLSGSGNEQLLQVSAVIEDMPPQQHFHFEYLAPIRFIEMAMGAEAMNNVGGNYNWLTYIRVSPNTEIKNLEKEMNSEFWDKYISPRENNMSAHRFYDFELQPLLDIHLKSNLEGEVETNGSIQQVYIFSSIGILLLLVACINYMNLATSHYSKRMKEVGVRKVLGAHKSVLVKQFLTESMLVTVGSFPLCLVLVYWAIPYLNGFMSKNLSFNPLAQPILFFGIFGLLIVVAVFSGLYPALFLSKINTVRSLKGERNLRTSKFNFRQVLVTFQYAVTIALIFALTVIESQMQFIRTTDPGYDRSNLLSLSIPRNISNLETFKSDLLSHPAVLTGAYSTRIPTGRLLDNWGSQFFRGDSAVSTSFRLPCVGVDLNFLATYGINLVAGENFRKGMETVAMQDSSTTGYYLINQAAASQLGFSNPNDIIGQKLAYGPTEGRIIGVMEDFHFESMHSPIVPMLIMHWENYRVLSLKIHPENIPNTLSFIEETIAKYDPENHADYRFVDELFENQYQNEERLATMIKVFAVIAIGISCLGLIGMIGFVIETKLKELGIRKALGASTQSIWFLITKNFLYLILISFAFALPLAYYFMSGWLDNFVYRTSFGFMIIFTPLLLTLVITIIATSYQSIKASLVNPVECLRNE